MIQSKDAKAGVTEKGAALNALFENSLVTGHESLEVLGQSAASVESGLGRSEIVSAKSPAAVERAALQKDAVNDKVADPVAAGSFQNRLIDPATGLSTHGKIKVWSLGHLLSVLSGRMHTRNGLLGEIAELCGFLTGHDVEILGTNAKGSKIYSSIDVQIALGDSKKAAALILAQYPELANIDPPAFNSEEAAYAWVAEQEAKFGKDLPVVQITQK